MSRRLKSKSWVDSQRVENSLEYENKTLKRALAQSEELRSLSIQFSQLDCPKLICESFIKLMISKPQVSRVFISHIGEEHIFSLAGEEARTFDDLEFMQNIRHGKINYAKKVTIVNGQSHSSDINRVLSAFPVELKADETLALLNIEQQEMNFYSVLLTINSGDQELDSIYFYRLQQLLEIHLLRAQRNTLLETQLVRTLNTSSQSRESSRKYN